MKASEENKARALAALIDDFESHVTSLREQGVTEIECFGENTFSHSQIESDMKANVMNIKTPRNVKASADVEQGLQEIAKEADACRKCGLHEGRSRVVPGQGSSCPDILFIGEGPGRDEDEQGLAFVGAAGKLLTKIINAMGYSREEVFIANIVKCRPPENRKPLPDEMNACLPFLKKQIALLSPKIIVTLGATALEGLSGAPVTTISKQRGVWMEFESIPLMPTFHPSYLLRSPSAKKPVWDDMQAVLKRLNRKPPRSS